VAALNDADRFVERWGELLELGSIQRRPYVSSGLVLLGGEEGAEVLELLDDRQRLADVARGYYGANDSSYPFLYPEQDVLNAILCSRPKGELTVRLPHRLAPAPPYPGLRVLDAGERRCAYDDGTEPFLLHQIVRKPWLEPAYHGPYSRLLARVLLADDAPVPVAADELPLRMRDGLVALLERKRVDALDLLRWYGLERLPRWLARRSRTVRGTRRHTP